MRKLWVKILLIIIISLNLLPINALADGNSSPPSGPYEKVAAKKGSWYTTNITYDDKAQLVVGYRGSYLREAEAAELPFTLAEKTLVTGILVPYAGMDADEVALAIVDSRGNVYQGFESLQEFTGGLVEGSTDNKDQDLSEQNRNTSNIFTPLDNMVLPKGAYTLYLAGEKLPVDVSY